MALVGQYKKAPSYPTDEDSAEDVLAFSVSCYGGIESVLIRITFTGFDISCKQPKCSSAMVEAVHLHVSGNCHTDDAERVS